jgi:hypothetical protein
MKHENGIFSTSAKLVYDRSYLGAAAGGRVSSQDTRAPLALELSILFSVFILSFGAVFWSGMVPLCVFSVFVA